MYRAETRLRRPAAAGRCLCAGYCVPRNEIPDHDERHAECLGVGRRRPYERLALEKKTIRLRLHEQSPARSAAADACRRDILGFEPTAVGRCASTNASSRSASASRRRARAALATARGTKPLRRRPFENPRTRKCGFLLMFVHVCSPARSPIWRLPYHRVGLLAAPHKRRPSSLRRGGERSASVP